MSNQNDSSQKKQGTRVYKKSSPNSKITVYLGKRDFIDYQSHVEPIDGVVLVDPEYVNGRKVYVQVLAAFRYGREDLDVLGLNFRKDLFIATSLIFPPSKDESRELTKLQERLIKKLGANAYPFIFQLPKSSPSSVTLQPAPGDTGKPCGVDHELKAYVVDSADEKQHKRSLVRLAIRKLTYAQEEPAPQPIAEVTKGFLTSSGQLRLEASLDKEKYYHGETITINVLVDNNTTRTVKRIKISVRQYAEICLFSKAQYKCAVAEFESDEGFPIHGNQTGFCKVYTITPLLTNNRDKRGLALDGKLKHEDTNLASSTILDDNSQVENLGIVVQYKVKVRLILGFGSGDLSLELPFTLTHPKPKDSPPPSRAVSATPVAALDGNTGATAVPPEVNLIQLDVGDDDLIFEDFARLRLKGHEADEADA